VVRSNLNSELYQLVRMIDLHQSAHHTPSVSTDMDRKNTTLSQESRSGYSLASAVGTEVAQTAKRPALRIAVKAQGKIFLIEIADIMAVHAEGNYASLKHRSSTLLMRESLCSVALKLKPFGFIQIHRSVLVNASQVDEIWPSSTGEYRLRVRNGKEYVVTRRYKDNLRQLAYVWLGSERVFGAARVE
jgi:DNA-binding LytR/AlgR family response regulator